MPPIWSAAHAGTCYPSEAKAALKFFQQALTLAEEPSVLPQAPEAWIVPHIDFRVDLSTYASVYRHLTHGPSWPETFYILGVGHHSPEDFSLCAGTFVTPLGEVTCDTEAIREIREQSRLELNRSPTSYAGEHSLEFVVVWLQALRDLFFPGKDFRVIPVLVGGLPEHVIAAKPPGPRTAFCRFGRALMDSHEKRRASSLILASIDGCHVGPRFGHEFPADETVQQAVWSWESDLWALASQPRLQDYYQHLGSIRNAFYFDGVGALTLLLQNRHMKSHVFARKLWYEEQDQSLVTFSAGFMEML